MELKVTDEKDQPLLSRKVVLGELTFEAETPSRATVRKMLAEKLDTKEELVIVKRISTDFGFRKAMIEAYSYKNKESMKQVPNYLTKRHEK